MTRDDEQRCTDPPRLARWLLRVCCTRARLEEMEGDLHEIYVRTRARSGAARARPRYVLSVLDVCLRQVFARVAARVSNTSRRSGALRVYPSRIRICLVLTAALLVAIQGQWAGIAPTMLFVIDGIVELLVLVAAVISLSKQVFSSPHAGREKDASNQKHV
jgi:hypothetical protein